MKETGIIMSGNHPRLILDGVKTQTRRVMKPQPFKGAWNADSEHPSYGWFWKKLYQTWDGEEDFFKRLVKHCPYGQVGDRLWVRETLEKRNDGYAIYAADKEQVLIGGRGINEGVSWEWKKDTLNAMFMPRWASRITLEITEVRVERVQEISAVDALDEGMQMYPENDDSCPLAPDVRTLLEFKELWDSLNAKRGYGWGVNPWCWCISFKRLSE